MNSKPFSRREFLQALSFGAAMVALPGCVRSLVSSDTAHSVAPPNFVFILSDDQGWSNSSVLMDPNWKASASDFIETPNLERLAQRGMRFTNAYAPAAMCSPTRYGIQFGQTPARLLKTDNVGPTEESLKRIKAGTTIPQMLKKTDLGYVSAHIGKWHMRPGPDEFGYDVHDGPTGNGDGNLLKIGKPREGIPHVKLPEGDPKRIFSLTREANAFMEKEVKARKPFYLQLSHYAIHARLMGLPDTVEKYTNKQAGKHHYRPLFGACAEDLDTGIGMLLDKIDELGIADNTYIIFMADNGAESVRNGRERANMPLRRGKFTFFEGGIRVPMLAAGPGIHPGSVCTTPVWGCDILPTIHDLSGVHSTRPDNLDGGSLRTVFENKGTGEVARDREGLVFHCTRGAAWSGTRRQSAIRLGDYKLIKNYYNNDELLLFNVVKDPYEWHNLADSLPHKRDELLQKMNDYLTLVKAAPADMTPEEIYEMQHASESVKEKKRGWGVYWSTQETPSEYPIPSFSAEENIVKTK